MVVRRIAVVLVGTVLASPWWAAGAASADELTVADAAGDVWKHDGGADFPTTELVGSVANADVLSSRLRHGFRRVSIEARYSELTKGRKGVGIGAAMLTDARNTTYWVAVHFGPGNRAGTSSWSREDTFDGSCPSLRHFVDYEDDVVRMSFARACLDKPRWVEFDLNAGSQYWNGDHAYFWRDDPQSEEPSTVGLSVPLWRGRP